MVKIIWVKGGLVNNDRLSEAIEQLPEKKCVLIKVESVQQAIVELYEGEGTTALIICDRVLDMSLPQSELHLIAASKKIPYLTNGEEGVYTDDPIVGGTPAEVKRSMYETQRFRVKRQSFMSSFLETLNIYNVSTTPLHAHRQAL